jgi:hypothetical protein
MAKLRIIGDVHGKYKDYIALTKECDYSIQIGDMGFDYNHLKELDPDNHKFIAGNHDNMDMYPLDDHAVCNGHDYGITSVGGFKFFYVRGGFSIDWRMRQDHYLRTGIQTYWDNEELPIDEMHACFSYYKLLQPEFMITHECPRSISKYVGNNDILKSFGYDPRHFTTRTSELLEAMFQAHQPKMHFFGHYHVDFDEVINGTRFICLPELGYFDIEI